MKKHTSPSLDPNLGSEFGLSQVELQGGKRNFHLRALEGTPPHTSSSWDSHSLKSSASFILWSRVISSSRASFSFSRSFRDNNQLQLGSELGHHPPSSTKTPPLPLRLHSLLPSHCKTLTDSTHPLLKLHPPSETPQKLLPI